MECSETVVRLEEVGLSTGRRCSLKWFLRRLEPVSKLPSDALIGRIGPTTLYHVLAILWYQKKHELLLNKIQSLL